MDILVWPEFTALSFIGGLLFLGCLVATFLLFRQSAQKKKRRIESMDIVLHHGYDRHVSGNEIRRLKQFLGESSDQDLEQYRHSFHNLRKPLLIFVRRHPDKDSVRMYQKMAMEGLGSQLDGSSDVHRGEIGLTEIEGRKYIFLITEIEEEMEIVLPHSAPRLTGEYFRGYMYRPQSGGYNVVFTIDRKLSGGHYLTQVKEVQEAEDRHRMAFMELSGIIRAFIPETGMRIPDSGSRGRTKSGVSDTNAESTNQNGAASEGPASGRPMQSESRDANGTDDREREIIEFGVQLEKISDRAAAFSTGHDIMSYTRYHHLWELHLTLFDGTEFMSRGAFSKLPQGSRRYLFRFQETDPRLIEALKQEIERNQPFPERMN